MPRGLRLAIGVASLLGVGFLEVSATSGSSNFSATGLGETISGLLLATGLVFPVSVLSVIGLVLARKGLTGVTVWPLVLCSGTMIVIDSAVSRIGTRVGSGGGVAASASIGEGTS